MASANPQQHKELTHYFSLTDMEDHKKVAAVKDLFEATGAASAIKEEIARYTELANSELERIKLADDKKEALRQFGAMLMKRSV